jgi:hypothetical protein
VRLSPKAVLFIRSALEEPDADPLRQAVVDLEPDPWARDLTPRAAEIALEILVFAEEKMRRALDAPGLDEDDEADLLNDLGFVDSVEACLRKQLGQPLQS